MNNNLMNELLFKYRNQVVLDKSGPLEPADEKKERYICTIMHNMEAYGYTLSKNAYDKLVSLSIDDVVEIGKEILQTIGNAEDAQISYRPLYPNFPDRVMEMDHSELFFNAIMHYWSNGTLYPMEDIDTRFPLADRTGLKNIDFGSKKDLENVMSNLTISNVSLSPAMLQDLSAYYSYVGWSKAFARDLPNKENIALLSAKAIADHVSNINLVMQQTKTATDVLRIAAAMSGADISLAENPKFIKFSRPQKRALMYLLNRCGNMEEDMWRRPEQFKRLAERLSARDYPTFKNANQAFESISNGEKPITYAGKVEKAIYDKNIDQAVGYLMSRPGEFARKLDRLLRIADNKDMVIDGFNKVAQKVSVPVLLQVREHFLHRNDGLEKRVFFPKGNLQKSFNLNNDLKDIGEESCKAVAGVCEKALKEVFAKKEPLGKVYLSDEFKNHIVPFALRSGNNAKQIMTRGSSIPMDDKDETIRGFIWWTNQDGQSGARSEYFDDDNRIDLDLSVCFYDADWKYIDYIDYNNLKNKYGVHSGDIVNGGPSNGDGVAEFVDINRTVMKEDNVRYAVLQVHNFSGVNFNDMSNGKFGWMTREDPALGEIYETRTVEQRMDLVAPGTSVIPVIYDAEQNRFIWADMGMELGRSSNVKNTLDHSTALCYSVVNMKKPNMYDLVRMHVEARGEFTDNKEEADVVFDTCRNADRKTITPYDIDIIVSDLMSGEEKSEGNAKDRMSFQYEFNNKEKVNNKPVEQDYELDR